MTLAIQKNPSPPQVIALIERVQQALAAVEKPTEAAQLVKEADAIRYLAKKAECSTAVQNQAATVAILAKQRAGELLKKVELHRGGGDHRSHPFSKTTSPSCTRSKSASAIWPSARCCHGFSARWVKTKASTARRRKDQNGYSVENEAIRSRLLARLERGRAGSLVYRMAER